MDDVTGGGGSRGVMMMMTIGGVAAGGRWGNTCPQLLCGRVMGIVEIRRENLVGDRGQGWFHYKVKRRLWSFGPIKRTNQQTRFHGLKCAQMILWPVSAEGQTLSSWIVDAWRPEE